MTASKYLLAERSAKIANRYSAGARVASEARHFLYLHVRDHVRAGWSELPEGLTPRNLRDISAMAKARGDNVISSLCQSLVSAEI